MMMSRLILGTGCLITCMVTTATAGFYPAYGFVEASPLDTPSVFMTGTGVLDTGWLTADGFYFPKGQVLQGTARARTEPEGSKLLKSYAQAYSQPAANFPNPGPINAGSISQAGWRDVVYYDSPNHPDIRLWISSDGFLDPGAQLHYVNMTVLTFDPRTEFPTAPTFGSSIAFGDFLADATVSNNGLATTAFRGWDTYSYANGLFSGSTHFDVRYDAASGGYTWGLAALTRAAAAYGTSTSDFLSTLRLTAVTLTDGTPIDVRFDSGLQLSAVPEPASIVLFGTGAVFMFGYMWRRNAKARASAA